MSTLKSFGPWSGEPVISAICDLGWRGLQEADMVGAAWAYYYFSIQFRENLEIACEIFSGDQNLARLKREECDTDNLSPYAGIAAIGEKMDHDEFMRRALLLSPVCDVATRHYDASGQVYLQEIRAMDARTRALSICNYESGGLEKLFKAMLTAPVNGNALLQAFRFFMEAHIKFDSDPIEGHGALSRHLTGDAQIGPLWDAFGRLLVACAPNLTRPAAWADKASLDATPGRENAGAGAFASLCQS